MTDTSAYDRLLGHSRTRDAIVERAERRKAVHDALRAELGMDLLPPGGAWATAIVERMHAEADAERRAA